MTGARSIALGVLVASDVTGVIHQTEHHDDSPQTPLLGKIADTSISQPDIAPVQEQSQHIETGLEAATQYAPVVASADTAVEQTPHTDEPKVTLAAEQNVSNAGTTDQVHGTNDTKEVSPITDALASSSTSHGTDIEASATAKEPEQVASVDTNQEEHKPEISDQQTELSKAAETPDQDNGEAVTHETKGPETVSAQADQQNSPHRSLLDRILGRRGN